MRLVKMGIVILIALLGLMIGAHVKTGNGLWVALATVSAMIYVGREGKRKGS